MAKARNDQTKWYFVDRIFLNVTMSNSSRKPQRPRLLYTSQKNVAVMQGSSLVLWCIFGGTPTLEISWKKIGGLVVSVGIEKRNNERTFQIKTVQSSVHDGTFTCNASNSVGWMSYSFLVNVFSPPPPKYEYTDIDNPTFLNCKADGNPLPIYTWTYNGKPVAAEGRTSKIIIENPKNPDAAIYTCNASNIFGYVRKEFRLDRGNGSLIKIKTSQSDVVAVIGENATLTCTFDYAENFEEVKWTKNGYEFSPEQNNSYKLHKKGHKIWLQIVNVSSDHAAEYIIQIDNKIGTFTSTCIVTLVVLQYKGNLTIGDKPVDQETGKGANVTFPCRVSNSSTLSDFTVDWALDGNQIDFNSESRFIKQLDNSLFIHNVRNTDSGKYLCVARADYDVVSEFAILKVKDVPRTPAIRSLQCRHHTAMMEIQKSKTDHLRILFYQIEYYTNFDPEVWIVAEKHFSKDTFTFEMSLRPWRNYTFRVVAVNEFGASLPSSPVSLCSTGTNVPSENPKNVKLQGFNISSMTVFWKPMSEEEHNAPKFMYVVEWKLERDNLSDWHQEIVTDWRTNQITLYNLPSSSERYRIRVRAVNEVGESSEKAVELIGYAGLGQEDQPINIIAVAISSAVFALLVVVFLCIGMLLIKRYHQKSLISQAETEVFFHGDESSTDKDSAHKMPYDKEKYEIDLKSFTLDGEDVLGSGEFGMVCKGEVRTRGVTFAVAVKTANPSKIHRSIVNGLLSEIKVLAHVGKHQNIIELIGANTEQLKQGKIYIFLEMCPFGSLEKYLRSMRPVENTESSQLAAEDHSYANILEMDTITCTSLDSKASQDLIRWSSEICNGMAFLATKHVVHADIATRNVLLGSSREAKICDFGLSRRMYNYASYVKSQQEPLPWKWMAPESLRIHEFNEKTDVWAFGVTLWEIYSLGDSPYQGLSWDLNFVQMLQRGFRLREPEFNERDIYSVMKRCWNFNPDQRPSFADMVSELESKHQQ